MLAPLALSRDIALLCDALLGIAFLILLIARFKINSFIALIVASLLVGLLAGMPLPLIAVEFQKGVGNILS